MTQIEAKKYIHTQSFLYFQGRLRLELSGTFLHSSTVVFDELHPKSIQRLRKLLLYSL